MISALFILIVLSMTCTNSVVGFASYLTRDYCDIPLEVGEVMMGTAAKLNDEKKIKIFHNKIELLRDALIPKEGDLEVYLEPSSNQMVLEVSGGARFVNGGCAGAVRSNTNGAVIRLDPGSSFKNIRLTAAWANSFSGGVQIAAESFILNRFSERNEDSEL